MLVILDTTETCKDLLLSNIAFSVVSSLVSKGIITLIVPKIVVEETINHSRKEMEEAVKAVRTLKRLAPSLVENLPQMDLELCVQNYTETLLARLDELGAKQSGYEMLGVDVLVTRALQGRKPFDPSGRRGFRDAIIWETVLHELNQYQFRQKAILVTRNTNDFGEDGGLAADLRNDLVARGFPADFVCVSDGIAKCLSRYLEPRLDAVELEEGIQKGESVGFNAKQFYESSRAAILRELNDSIYNDPEEESQFRNLTVTDLGTLDRFEVCGIWSITDKEIMMHIDYIINSRVTFERLQERWQTVERQFQILINMMIVLKPRTHELLKYGISEFQFWPYNISSTSEREYLERG
jgi:PIN domain